MQTKTPLELLKHELRRLLQWEHRRGLHRLANDLETWSAVETEAYSVLCKYAQALDKDACRELAEWLGSCFPRDALLVVTPQLPPLLDRLGLRHYESVFAQVFTSLMQGVRDWSERNGANAVLLPEGATQGGADDVKLLRALVVDSRRSSEHDREKFFPDRPGAFAVNFEPDSACQEAMGDAVRACRKLFEPLKMLGLLWRYYWYLPIWKPVLPVTVGAVIAMYIWQGKPASVWILAFFLFCLSFQIGFSYFRWWRLLEHASIYFKVEGVVGEQVVKDRSMGMAAAVAVLLALREACPELRLLPPMSHFTRRLTKEGADWGFSGVVERKGEVREVSGVWQDDGRRRPGPKQQALFYAGVPYGVFPRDNRPPRTETPVKTGRPAESQTGTPTGRRLVVLFALRELPPYWVSSLGALLLRACGPFGRVWAIANLLVIVAEVVLLLFVPLQHAAIVDVFINDIRASHLSGGGFRGEILSANARFRFYVYADRYEPNLWLRIRLSKDLDGGCDPHRARQCEVKILKGGETRCNVYFTKIGPQPQITLEVFLQGGDLLCITHLFLQGQPERLPTH